MLSEPPRWNLLSGFADVYCSGLPVRRRAVARKIESGHRHDGNFLRVTKFVDSTVRRYIQFQPKVDVLYRTRGWSVSCHPCVLHWCESAVSRYTITDIPHVFVYPVLNAPEPTDQPRGHSEKPIRDCGTQALQSQIRL